MLLTEKIILFCIFDRELYHSKPQNIFCNLSRQNIYYNQFLYYFSEKIKRIAWKTRLFPPVAVFHACEGLLLIVNAPAFFLLCGESDTWLMLNLALSEP